MLQTRWYLIRPPSFACTCRKEMSWLSVAAYSFTGTLTRPKDTAPFQMARMGSSDREYGVRSPSWRTDGRRCPSRGRGAFRRQVLRRDRLQPTTEDDAQVDVQGRAYAVHRLRTGGGNGPD